MHSRQPQPAPRPRKKDEKSPPPVVPTDEPAELVTVPTRQDDTSSASLGEQVENRRSDQDPSSQLGDEG